MWTRKAFAWSALIAILALVMKGSAGGSSTGQFMALDISDHCAGSRRSASGRCGSLRAAPVGSGPGPSSAMPWLQLSNATGNAVAAAAKCLAFLLQGMLEVECRQQRRDAGPAPSPPWRAMHWRYVQMAPLRESSPKRPGPGALGWMRGAAA